MGCSPSSIQEKEVKMKATLKKLGSRNATRRSRESNIKENKRKNKEDDSENKEEEPLEE